MPSGSISPRSSARVESKYDAPEYVNGTVLVEKGQECLLLRVGVGVD